MHLPNLLDERAEVPLFAVIDVRQEHPIGCCHDNQRTGCRVVLERRLVNEVRHANVTASQKTEHKGVNVRLGASFDDEALPRVRREQNYHVVSAGIRVMPVVNRLAEFGSDLLEQRIDLDVWSHGPSISRYQTIDRCGIGSHNLLMPRCGTTGG